MHIPALASLLFALVALVACVPEPEAPPEPEPETEPDSEPETVPDDTDPPPGCDTGYIDDDGTCVPEECGTGTWGNLEVDAETVFVDAEAASGGDGSEASPFDTIQPGLDLAGGRGGGLVAVAGGTYAETLELDSDHVGVQLAGRCRALVSLDASVGDSGTPGITIKAGNEPATVSGLTVVDSSYVGVLVGSGEALLEDLGIESSAYIGLAAGQTSFSATTVRVAGCEIANNVQTGVYATESRVEVELSDTTIRDTQTYGGLGGYGIVVSDGGSLSAEAVSLDGNASVAVLVTESRSEANLTDTTIVGTRPDDRGSGGYGVQVNEGASLTAQGCWLDGNTGGGISLMSEGTQAEISDTTVQGTLPTQDNMDGYGLSVKDGATLVATDCVLEGNAKAGVQACNTGTTVELVGGWVVGTLSNAIDEVGCGFLVYDGATLAADGCLLDENTRAGVVTFDAGTEVTLVDTVVRSCHDPDGVEFGYSLSITEGARLTAEACELDSNFGLGVQAGGEGTSVVLLDSTIRNSLPIEQGKFGYGILVDGGANLSVERGLIEGNTEVGLVAMNPGTEVTLVDSTLSGTLVGYDMGAVNAVGLGVQDDAVVTASGLEIRDNEGPGLYAADGTLECTDCELLDNRFAGAVVADLGVLELESSTISGTSESIDTGGGVGVQAGQILGWGPPTLVLGDSVVSDNPVAGVHIAGQGSFQLSGNSFTGGTGLSHGVTTRCGDGVYASGTEAWDGSTGLTLDGNELTGNVGTGLFLDDAGALLEGNSWTDNDLDLLVQGDACLEPPDAWADVPSSEICPQWDRPACDLGFTLDMVVDSIETARMGPPAPSMRSTMAPTTIVRMTAVELSFDG